MNAWSVVALVTGVLPLFPIAVGAGITALVQISRRSMRGTGMAIAGLVLAGCWVLFGALAAIGFLVGDESSGALGRVAAAGSTTVGTCLATPDPQDFIGTPVACDTTHDAEVFAVQQIDASYWPGIDGLAAHADDICRRAFSRYVGQPYDDSDYDYGYFDPDRAEWRSGERRVVCVVLPGAFDDSLTGSVRHDG